MDKANQKLSRESKRSTGIVKLFVQRCKVKEENKKIHKRREKSRTSGINCNSNDILLC